MFVPYMSAPALRTGELQPGDLELIDYSEQMGNQSINVKFVGCRYTRRPGAPTVVSGTHDQKVHS